LWVWRAAGLAVVAPTLYCHLCRRGNPIAVESSKMNPKNGNHAAP
jgi:hypothetical protein